MPIYEYRCDACAKTMSFLLRNMNHPPPSQCRFCQGGPLNRLISRIATPKSEESRMERLTDPSVMGGLDENNPQEMAHWMKNMAGEMGEDLDDESLAEMESAVDQMPDSNTESID